MNKCIYFLEGAKKVFCRKTVSINGFIDTFTVYDNEENSVHQESFFSDNNDEFELNNNKALTNENNNHEEKNLNAENNHEISENNKNIKNSNNSQKIKYQFISAEKLLQNGNNNDNHKCLVLKGKPCSIIFQNIINYMSGVKDIWGNGKDHLSVKLENGTKEEQKKYKDKLVRMASFKQKFDDKMLEVFTFDSGLKTGFENIIKGFAKKIYHGRGPMEVKFLETPKYEKGDRTHRIYFNLDGEYFHIVKPILLKIELNRDYLGGQLPFLIGNKK